MPISLFTFNSFHKKIVHPPAIFSVTPNRTDQNLDKDDDEYLQQYLTAGSGFMLGLGGVFCREPHIPALTVVVSAQVINSIIFVFAWLRCGPTFGTF